MVKHSDGEEEEEEEEEVEEAPKAPVEAAPKAPVEQERQLSKKELKKKELEDLDAMFAEMGVEVKAGFVHVSTRSFALNFKSRSELSYTRGSYRQTVVVADDGGGVAQRERDKTSEGRWRGVKQKKKTKCKCK